MIKVLASGSKGNCYIVQAEGETLLLECGIAWKEILKGLDFNIDNVIGCLVTHEHRDHCKAIREVLKSGIDVYTSIGTSREIAKKSYIETYHRLHFIKSKEMFKVGGFTIFPFLTEHDTAEPLGFVINHRAIGSILFATDTYYLKYKFKGINHMLIECNYSEDILEELEPYQARLFKSHMSLETLKEFLKASDLSKLEDITLIHISENNGDPERFKEEIESVTGIPVYIAAPNLEIS